MSALDMLEDGFPHGTVDGYTRGCRTNHCPAPITCTELRTRYVSDWAFRKRVDAGWTVEQLAEADAVEAAERRDAERAAARALRLAARPARRTPTRTRSVDADPPVEWTGADIALLRELHAEGLNDGEIAARIGRKRNQVQWKRAQLGIAPQPRQKGRPHGTVSGYTNGGCRGEDCPVTPSCRDVGRAYHAARRARLRAEAAA